MNVDPGGDEPVDVGSCRADGEDPPSVSSSSRAQWNLKNPSEFHLYSNLPHRPEFRFRFIFIIIEEVQLLFITCEDLK